MDSCRTVSAFLAHMLNGPSQSTSQLPLRCYLQWSQCAADLTVPPRPWPCGVLWQCVLRVAVVCGCVLLVRRSLLGAAPLHGILWRWSAICGFARCVAGWATHVGPVHRCSAGSLQLPWDSRSCGLWLSVMRRPCAPNALNCGRRSLEECSRDGGCT